MQGQISNYPLVQTDVFRLNRRWAASVTVREHHTAGHLTYYVTGFRGHRQAERAALELGWAEFQKAQPYDDGQVQARRFVGDVRRWTWRNGWVTGYADSRQEAIEAAKFARRAGEVPVERALVVL